MIIGSVNIISWATPGLRKVIHDGRFVEVWSLWFVRRRILIEVVVSLLKLVTQWKGVARWVRFNGELQGKR